MFQTSMTTILDLAMILISILTEFYSQTVFRYAALKLNHPQSSLPQERPSKLEYKVARCCHPTRCKLCQDFLDQKVKVQPEKLALEKMDDKLNILILNYIPVTLA